MKKFALIRLLALPLLAATILAGCKKDSSEDTLSPQEEEAAARIFTDTEAENELVFNDVFDNVMGVNTEVGLGGTGVFGRAAGEGRGNGVDSVQCFTVSVALLNAPAPFPRRITVDFGTGCVGNDGRSRSGKIIITYTGKLLIPGNSATTSFENFKIDSLSVQGIHKIENIMVPGTIQRKFKITVTDGKLSRPNGNYSMWTSTRVITQAEGNGTDTPLDDVFTITGAAHGKVKKGNNIYLWHSEITEPLRKRFICDWITRGVLKVWRDNLPAGSPWVAILNYGQGLCDDQATLTINGISQQITLH